MYALEYFFRVFIAISKHSGGWKNSRQLCKAKTHSRVSITLENSPNPPRVGKISKKKIATLLDL